MTEVLEQEQNLRDKIKEYDTLYSNYQESHDKLKELEKNVLPSIED
jgi:phage shock protein A